MIEGREELLPFPAQSVLAGFAEELSIPLHSSEGTYGQHACAIEGEEGAYIMF